jgi:hypothetical protein
MTVNFLPGSLILSTLKMEVTRLSETAVPTRATRHIPEDGILHCHHGKTSNLTSCLFSFHILRQFIVNAKCCPCAELSTAIRHTAEWMYTSTFSWPRLWLEVTVELHAPADLPPVEDPTASVGWEYGQSHRTSLNCLEKRNFLMLPGLEAQSLGLSARSQSLYRLQISPPLFVNVWKP